MLIRQICWFVSQIHQETFGKSGCRRIVPGQYLAVDPKGRAVMIGWSGLYCLLVLVYALSYSVIFKCRILKLTFDSASVESGSVEKQKLVYILNRDAQARLTISSPLEAHKSNTLVYHMVGVDVGFENPTFACLEIDYEVHPHEIVAV